MKTPRYYSLLMRHGLFIAILFFMTAWAWAAAPVVSNVRAAQRPGAGLVDIYYDVADADGDSLGITVLISFNAGSSYSIQPENLSGAGYGRQVAPGQNKHIVWDASAELPPLLYPNMRVKIVADDGLSYAPPEVRYIPGGSFSMGDNYNEGGSDERPVHGVFVSGFFMDKFEVSKALWDDICAWAALYGYGFDNPGTASGPDHPVHSISWHDAVKWCNARSESLGLTPVYYTDTAQTTVYRKGKIDVQAGAVKWSANGFRLPTEAEWEKAARGGLLGHHYPWPSFGGSYSSHINGSKANYYDSRDPFDNGTTPVGYYNGSQQPAGVDMANGYGLYDMAGNVYEWCWDWHSGSWYSQQEASNDNTHGPSSGSSRVLRGGSWFVISNSYLRCANRNRVTPSYANFNFGFRCVRGH